jgi:anti-sigma regulatory factor (Ser/Thr protein kinase)
MMTTSESNPNLMTCRAQGATAIRDVSDAARFFGTAQMLNDDELARLCIVIEELVANLYDHGGLTERDHVDLTLVADTEGIHVTIFDRGKPFDPWSALPVAERLERGGGAGIEIVRAWVQLIQYKATDEGNLLQFRLPIRWDR